jgi:GNAT superfamily N-acetyltransferase
MAFVDGAAFLAFAALEPELRGSGIGAALFEARREAARLAGYATLVTDFRMTNLLSSRFFLRRGFRTTFARLFRAIV